MSREWWLLLILLILNLSIVIIYLVWNLLIRCRENKHAAVSGDRPPFPDAWFFVL